MAALGTIRKRGALLIGIVGLGLFGFIAGDVFRSCETQSNEQRMQVGEVLGEKISVQEFQTQVDELQEVYKIMQGRDNFTEDELNMIKDEAWNMYVNMSVLNAEAEKVGLTVTDEELQNVITDGTNQMLRNITIFVNPQTGRFDASALQEFLTAYKTMNAAENPQMAEQYQMIYKYWKFMEKNLRQNLLANKYQALMGSCLLSNPVAAKAAFDNKNVVSDILLVSVPYSSISDSVVKVSDADIKAKYEEDKEKMRAEIETRDIKYVTYPVVASDADRAALMASLNDVASQLKDAKNPAELVRKAQSLYSYSGLPVSKNAYSADIAEAIDTMKVGQVMSPFETRGDNTFNVIKLVSKVTAPDSIEYRRIAVGGATMDAAKQTADSIVLALKGGAVFDSLAVKYGQTGAKEWMTTAGYEKAQIIPADDKKFIEAVLALGVNETKVLELSNYCVVLQGLDRRAMIDKYVAAVVKAPINFSDETYSTAYNKFSQYVSESQTLAALEENAAKYGFVVMPAENVANSVHNIANVSGTGDALKWLFDEAEVGDVSPLYECGNNDRLMVVALAGVNPKGYMKLDKVKSYLEQEIVLDKKYDASKQQFDGVKDLAAAYDKGMQVDTIPGITFATPVYLSKIGMPESALSAAVAATEEGKFSTAVVKGNGGAYMFQVLKKSPRANQVFDAVKEENALKQTSLRNVMGLFQNELVINGKVVDNRYLFF